MTIVQRIAPPKSSARVLSVSAACTDGYLSLCGRLSLLCDVRRYFPVGVSYYPSGAEYLPAAPTATRVCYSDVEIIFREFRYACSRVR